MSAEPSIDAILRWRGAASFAWMTALLAWESSRPCHDWFRSWRHRGRHAVINLALALGNVLLVALLFTSLWRWVADLTAARNLGLLNTIPMTGWARTLATLLLLDLWTYGWHRACHRIPLLWRFHRVHHSDAAMDVTTANRFHAGEILLSGLLRLLLIPALGIRFQDLVVYETILQVCVQWHHANIRLSEPWERRLRQWVVTPGLHQVHHSREQPQTDSNYASVLPVWDRIFRSLRLHAHPEAIRIGQDGLDAPAQQTLGALVGQPFRR